MNLSFGLLASADSIFKQLKNNGPLNITPAQSWLQSARLHYKSGNWLAAQQALDNVSSDENSDEISHYLKAQLALKNGQVDDFNRHLSKIVNNAKLTAYLQHNRLLTRIKQQQVTAADLQQLISRNDGENALIKLSDEEEALSQRSLLVLGYAFIEQGNNELAKTAFQSLDVDSHLIEPALLGYALALNNLSQFSLAQGVFQRLISRPGMSIYVQEAILGDAYVSEKLGDEKASVRRLRSGI